MLEDNRCIFGANKVVAGRKSLVKCLPNKSQIPQSFVIMITDDVGWKTTGWKLQHIVKDNKAGQAILKQIFLNQWTQMKVCHGWPHKLAAHHWTWPTPYASTYELTTSVFMAGIKFPEPVTECESTYGQNTQDYFTSWSSRQTNWRCKH